MFTYNINYITGFLCIPPLSVFLFLDGGYHVAFSPHVSRLISDL